MANIHVLVSGSADINVVCHIAIPVGNNAAGVPWSTALINSGMGGTTALKSGDGTAGTISAAELSSIQAGTLYEAPGVARPQGAVNVSTYLSALYNAIKTDALNKLQAQLNYFGYSA